MKTIQEILNSEAVFLNDWKDLKQEDVLAEFRGYRNEYSIPNEGKINILFASYGYEDYNGDAFVLYTLGDGKLYETNGSHCSCYGLENQWDRNEEVILQELQTRLSNGMGTADYAGNCFNAELKEFIGI